MNQLGRRYKFDRWLFNFHRCCQVGVRTSSSTSDCAVGVFIQIHFFVHTLLTGRRLSRHPGALCCCRDVLVFGCHLVVGRRRLLRPTISHRGPGCRLLCGLSRLLRPTISHRGPGCRLLCGLSRLLRPTIRERSRLWSCRCHAASGANRLWYLGAVRRVDQAGGVERVFGGWFKSVIGGRSLPRGRELVSGVGVVVVFRQRRLLSQVGVVCTPIWRRIAVICAPHLKTTMPSISFHWLNHVIKIALSKNKRAFVRIH
jgi:hypothetical protein